MGDINRFLILLILVGLLFALYKYQDTILGNLDSLQSSVNSSLFSSLTHTQSLPIQSISTQAPPLQLPTSIKTPNLDKKINKKEKKITADNISQISILSFNDNNFDINSLSNSDNISIILDDNTCDTRASKQTYGSLFDN